MESGEIKKYYEWNEGPLRGRTEIYLAENETDVFFESGRSINKSRLDIDLFSIDEEIFNRKNPYQNSMQFDGYPLSSLSNIWMNEELLNGPAETISPNKEETIEINNKEEDLNPIKIILDKQKGKEDLWVSIEFRVEIPSKKVLEVLDLMFDREEVIEEIIKSTSKQIENQNLFEISKNTIRGKIKNIFDSNKIDD